MGLAYQYYHHLRAYPLKVKKDNQEPTHGYGLRTRLSPGFLTQPLPIQLPFLQGWKPLAGVLELPVIRLWRLWNLFRVSAEVAVEPSVLFQEESWNRVKLRLKFVFEYWRDTISQKEFSKIQVDLAQL